MNSPYSSVPWGSSVVVLGCLVEDEEGLWLSYPVDPSGGVGRSYGAVLTSIADGDLARQMASAGLMVVTGRWDGELIRVTNFDRVSQDWAEKYLGVAWDGLTPEEAFRLVTSIPAELESSINAIEHCHPGGYTRKIRVSVTLFSPQWDQWRATVDPWVEITPIMHVLAQ